MRSFHGLKYLQRPEFLYGSQLYPPVIWLKNPIVAESELKSKIRFIKITFPKSTPYAQRQKVLVVLTTVSSSKHILS